MLSQPNKLQWFDGQSTAIIDSQSGLEHAGRNRTLEQAIWCRSLMSFNDLMVGARPHLRMRDNAHRVIPSIQSQNDELRTPSSAPLRQSLDDN